LDDTVPEEANAACSKLFAPGSVSISFGGKCYIEGCTSQIESFIGGAMRVKIAVQAQSCIPDESGQVDKAMFLQEIRSKKAAKCFLVLWPVRARRSGDRSQRT